MGKGKSVSLVRDVGLAIGVVLLAALSILDGGFVSVGIPDSITVCVVAVGGAALAVGVVAWLCAHKQ